MASLDGLGVQGDAPRVHAGSAAGAAPCRTATLTGASFTNNNRLAPASTVRLRLAPLGTAPRRPFRSVEHNLLVWECG